MNNTINCPDSCSTIGSQKAKICLPVSVIPYAITSPAIINCCGNTSISTNCDCDCKGEESSCEFIISQVINVDVPVEFGASVKIGETYIQCNAQDDIDTYISEDEQVETLSEEVAHDAEFLESESEDVSTSYFQESIDEDEDDPYLGA